MGRQTHGDACGPNTAPGPRAIAPAPASPQPIPRPAVGKSTIAKQAREASPSEEDQHAPGSQAAQDSMPFQFMVSGVNEFSPGPLIFSPEPAGRGTATRTNADNAPASPWSDHQTPSEPASPEHMDTDRDGAPPGPIARISIGPSGGGDVLEQRENGGSRAAPGTGAPQLLLPPHHHLASQHLPLPTVPEAAPYASGAVGVRVIAAPGQGAHNTPWQHRQDPHAHLGWGYGDHPQQPSYDADNLLSREAEHDDDSVGYQGMYYSPPAHIKSSARTAHGTATHGGSPTAALRSTTAVDVPPSTTSGPGPGQAAPQGDSLHAPAGTGASCGQPSTNAGKSTGSAQGLPPRAPPLQRPQQSAGNGTAAAAVQPPWQGRRSGSSGGGRAQAGRARYTRSSTTGSRARGAGREMAQLLRLALPCVIITGSTQVVIVASQVMAGHLGTQALAAASVGNVLWLVGYYAVIGTATALETLGAQAVGAGDLGRLVVWVMTAGICSTLLAFPLAAALWKADLLVAALLAQPPEFCALVLKYCRGLVPGLLPQVWAIILSKHMQAQSQMILPALAAGSTAVVYIAVAPYCVTWAGGLLGVSVAATLARVYQCLAMLVAVLVFEAYKGTQWCSEGTWVRGMARWQMARRPRSVHGFLALGAPGCLGSAIESGGWEVTTAMACYLGTLQVAVHSSALSLATLVIMCVPMAIAIAANVRVAGLLGAGQARRAQLCARLAVGVGTSITCALGGVMLWQRNNLGWIFTASDEAVVHLLASIAPLVALYQALAGLLGSTQGVLRGLGRQATLVVHHSLGLGAGTLLGAWLTWGPPDQGLAGLWAGSILGTGITALLNSTVLLLVDWGQEVYLARTMQAMQQGVRARQRMLYRALQNEDIADEALAEALLAEAQQDPRPLHIIYQEYAWAPEAAQTTAPPVLGISTSANQQHVVSMYRPPPPAHTT